MESALPFWPLIVLGIGIVLVVVLITILRLHAFLALMLSAIVVGMLSQKLPEGEITNHLIQAVELSMVEFGGVAGQIAWVIALAAILGMALTESGAAESIVSRFLKLFPKSFAPYALLAASFILSIPVFFDTVFFLLIPIVYSMGRRMTENYLLYVLAICVGAVITHSLVPPTPGPLIMAETLQINMGLVIIAGLGAGILPAIAGLQFAVRIKNRFLVDPPELATVEQTESGKPQELPAFSLSLLPILLPLLLIILASVTEFLQVGNHSFTTVAGFIGNKNIAMLVGTAVSLWILADQKNWNFRQLEKVMQRPLEIAGLIILITGAGGAFGAMIRHAGIGDTIQELSGMGYEINFILLAWIITSALKTAQGSGTVAMITASAIMAGLLESTDQLAFHPVYILISIGFGSMAVSWMNDSAFWVVGKLSGFNEKQTLQSWTLALLLISVTGLIQTLLLAYIFPMI
ncbi:MAG: SLC13 family permease [Balneolaceae bacterium]